MGFLEKPVSEPGPDHAVVKTTRALICTSDSHTVRGAIGPRANLTLGHEAVGIVYQVGGNVKLFKPGDRVISRFDQRPAGACRSPRDTALTLEKARPMGVRSGE
ncbi:MAG TPA: alcohol dehydrogenase catalytic domain-containing protein [Ktedonobacterales bacterium]|nr:alcohol dehydrogenase catalytic domain-containing protein [Ktedonobacterales bacterium]